VVVRRGRLETVCARVAFPTWSFGPSTSPLGVMRVTLSLAALALLASCEVASTDISGVGEVPFEILRTGSIPGVYNDKSMLTLAHNETEFRRLWVQLHVQSERGTPEAAPTVDFHHSIVVTFFAAFGDNCDPYRLVRVLASHEKVTLHVNHQVPGKDCTCGSSVFEPYIIVRIPRTEKPIGFEIESETHDCG
jgi:hypothetical protein